MTQRKRATGFALMDTAFAADAKFVRLARKAADPVAFAAAVGVYWLILADARRAREAVVNWDDYTEYSDQLASLKEARLITDSGFDEETFDRWAPAYKTPAERTRSYPPVPDGTHKAKGSEHGADPTVPSRTASTDTSTQIISNQVTNGVGGAGGGAPPVFLGFPPKKPRKLTPEEITSFRRFADSADPVIAKNARETLEKAGVSIEEDQPA